MRRVCAKPVPKILTPDQKVECVAIATKMLRRSTEDQTFMASIVTGAESLLPRDEDADVTMEKSR